MTKWIEYTGSDEQIEEMQKPGNTFYIKNVNNEFSGPFIWMDTKNHPDPRLRAFSDLKKGLKAGKGNVTHYLICEPHPYANEIKIRADTGCEVWWRMIPENHVGLICIVFKTNKPDWNIPGAEYRLTPFEG